MHSARPTDRRQFSQSEHISQWIQSVQLEHFSQLMQLLQLSSEFSAAAAAPESHRRE